ncbi:MAG: tRNA (adenosine(37)-N6)-dimethylallyltransferase MiaA [Bacteroidetes bacterium]|nr:MAG: tRNA (adenosine(37)-N6)-dimethylallyltransferase MiaA [Bacteroidota bacterium]
MDSTLIVVGGPTASGKTKLAIELAQHYDTVVLSADSRQFYRELQIGTARPSTEELRAVTHYFIADRSIQNPLSAGAYAREALALLAQLFQTQQHIILVGGSGLYIKALCEGLDEFPAVTDDARQRVAATYQSAGLEGLRQALRLADPTYYEEVDLQNPARLRRALEVSWSGDLPYSAYRKTRSSPRPFVCKYLLTDWPRQTLYQRINQRVEQMVAAGLEAEARSLADQQALPVLQTVGYQEWFPYFRGAYDRQTAIECIKRNSRRYAKRQLTWFRRDEHWQKIARGDLALALDTLRK